MKRALIIDGDVRIAGLLEHWRRFRTAGVRLVERSQEVAAKIRGLLPAPEDADAVRVGGLVVSRWRESIRVEPETPELPYQMMERRGPTMTAAEIIDTITDEQRDNRP